MFSYGQLLIVYYCSEFVQRTTLVGFSAEVLPILVCVSLSCDVSSVGVSQFVCFYRLALHLSLHIKSPKLQHINYYSVKETIYTVKHPNWG